jgi:hypothetical protein
MRDALLGLWSAGELAEGSDSQTDSFLVKKGSCIFLPKKDGTLLPSPCRSCHTCSLVTGCWKCAKVPDISAQDGAVKRHFGYSLQTMDISPDGATHSVSVPFWHNGHGIVCTLLSQLTSRSHNLPLLYRLFAHFGQFFPIPYKS